MRLSFSLILSGIYLWLTQNGWCTHEGSKDPPRMIKIVTYKSFEKVSINRKHSKPCSMFLKEQNLWPESYSNGGYSFQKYTSQSIKTAGRDAIYFAKSNLSTSFIHQEIFDLMWQVVFKLEYLLCQGRQDNFYEFEWTWQKVFNYNYSI